MNDNEDLASKAAGIIDNIPVFIPNEILIEVVYVLEKVYKVERMAIYEAIIELLSYDNIAVADKDVIETALDLYRTIKFDIVDTLLLCLS